MAGNTRQVAAFGPAAVAVHDDRDMFWELVRIKLAVEFSSFRSSPKEWFAKRLSIHFNASTAALVMQFPAP